jgi:hypothetical protein
VYLQRPGEFLGALDADRDTVGFDARNRRLRDTAGLRELALRHLLQLADEGPAHLLGVAHSSITIERARV